MCLCLACSGGLRWSCFLVWKSIVFLLVRLLRVGWKSRKGVFLNPERIGVLGSGRCGVGGTGARYCDSLCCLGVGGVKYAFIPDAHLFLLFSRKSLVLYKIFFYYQEKFWAFFSLWASTCILRDCLEMCNSPKSGQGALSVALFWPLAVYEAERTIMLIPSGRDAKL